MSLRNLRTALTGIGCPARRSCSVYLRGRQVAFLRSNLPCVLRSMELKAVRTMSSSVGFDNYEEGCKNFHLDIPEYFNFARDVVDKWAEQESENEVENMALWWLDGVDREYKWTFKQLSNYSKGAAYMLTGPLGLQKGDRVIVMLPNFPQYWILYLACLRTGIVFIPLSTSHPGDRLMYRIQISKAKCLVTDDLSIPRVDSIIEQCPTVTTKVYVPRSRSEVHRKLGWLNYADVYRTSKRNRVECEDTKSEDPMCIYFTSGTTGRPKMVEHTHASYGLGSLITGKYWLDLTREDIHWNMSDPGWAKTAWGSVFGPWLQGAGIFAYHTDIALEPERILQILETFPITTFCTTPPNYRHMIQEDLSTYKFPHLRQCTSCGEYLNPEVIDKWEQGTGIVVRDGFGQTETVLTIGNFPCIKAKPGSMGKPAPGFDIRVLDEDTNEVEVGQLGTIAVKVAPDRPVGLFSRYVDDPVKTMKAFSGDYYLTGDKGFVDEDGYFWYVSRDADFIYVDGHAISPFEVESVMIEHPAVAECAAVSSPDHLQLTGQVVKTFVVLKDGYEDTDEEYLLDELHQHSRKYLLPHKQPKEIAFVDGLPKTVTGKIRRVQLRRDEWHMHRD